jgi:hypothetical protein
MSDYACCGPRKHLPTHAGLHASQIAKTLTLDPRTVAPWLAQEPFRPRQPRQSPRQLAPFTPELVRWLERSPSAAAQIFQRRRERGLDGGSSLVTASGRPGRPRRHAALLTLAVAPGACAPGDWGAFGAVPVGHTPRPLRGVVRVLCASRRRYVACTVSQPLAPCLACPHHAWAFCGGIPHQRMGDTLTSAVLPRAVGAAPVVNPP